MKNTKYIKVSTADRLPEVNKCVKVIDQEDNIYDGFITDKQVWQVYTQFEYGRIEYWLQEKPDYEEEMKEMLEELNNSIDEQDTGIGISSDLNDAWVKIQNLLTKIKQS